MGVAKQHAPLRCSVGGSKGRAGSPEHYSSLGRGKMCESGMLFSSCCAVHVEVNTFASAASVCVHDCIVRASKYRQKSTCIVVAAAVVVVDDEKLARDVGVAWSCYGCIASGPTSRITPTQAFCEKTWLR